MLDPSLKLVDLYFPTLPGQSQKVLWVAHGDPEFLSGDSQDRASSLFTEEEYPLSTWESRPQDLSLQGAITHISGAPLIFETSVKSQIKLGWALPALNLLLATSLSGSSPLYCQTNSQTQRG